MAKSKSKTSGRVREAEAKARVAEAEAKAAAARAEAESRAAAAKLESERIAAASAKQAAADRRADDLAAAKRDTQGFRAIATTTGVVTGIAAGKGLAHLVDARFVASVAAKNAALGDLAARAAKTGAAASSKAATRAGLTKARAPLGIGLAAALLAEAAYVRFGVSPKLDDSPRSQAIADASATASTMAAIGLVGSQAINRATPKAVLDATAMATIATGARVSGRKTAGTAPKPGPSPKPGTVPALRAEAKTLNIAGAEKMRKADLQKAIAAAQPPAPSSGLAGGLKRMLGRALPAAAAVLFAGAGYAQASKDGASRSEAVKAGATAGADALTGGAVSSYAAEKARGGSTTMATTRSVIEGIGNIMTFGLAGMMSDSAKRRETIGYVPESVQKRIDREKSVPPVPPSSDIGRRAMFAGAGAVGMKLGLETLRSARGERGFTGFAGRAGGRLMMATGALTALGSLLPSSKSSGAAYLNDGAKAKAQRAPSPGGPTRSASPALAGPDGMTAGYMRVDPRTGKTVQVKGYRTPGH